MLVYLYLTGGANVLQSNISHDLITLCYESVCLQFYDIAGSLIEKIKKVDEKIKKVGQNIVVCAMDLLDGVL